MTKQICSFQPVLIPRRSEAGALSNSLVFCTDAIGTSLHQYETHMGDTCISIFQYLISRAMKLYINRTAQHREKDLVTRRVNRTFPQYTEARCCCHVVSGYSVNSRSVQSPTGVMGCVCPWRWRTGTTSRAGMDQGLSNDQLREYRCTHYLMLWNEIFSFRSRVRLKVC